MRYWGTDEKTAKKRRIRVSRKSKPEPRPVAPPKPAPAKSSVASGGSVKPFLRRIYQHQAVVGGPIQRFFLFLVMAGLIYAFVLGDGGAIRIAVLKHDLGKVDNSVEELRVNAEKLKVEIARLETDPFFIEKAGREKFSYVRPNEHVYKIVPPQESK